MATKQDGIVVAVAAQEVQGSQEIALPLPQGAPQTGLVFSCDSQRPLHVAQTNAAENPELKHYGHIAGHYVVAIRLSELGATVSHFRSPTDIHRILEQTYTQKRELVLSPTPPVLDQRITGLLYVYEIPSHETSNQNFKLDGFPPRIQSMNPQSRLNVILRPGMFVVSFLVPQLPDFQFNSPGFTGYAIEDRMGKTANIPGRWISFTEVNPVPPAPQEGTPWFDFGGIFTGRKPRGRRL